MLVYHRIKTLNTYLSNWVVGVLALAVTQQYYLISEIATRVLPALCSLTCDVDKSVRENAFRTIKGFIGKLERVSEDPSLKEKYG